MKRQETASIYSKIRLFISILAGIISILLIISQMMRNETINAGVFFIAGGSMLLSILLLSYHAIRNLGLDKDNQVNMIMLSIKNLMRNKNRSISIIILLALGTFIVISTGVNRKDVFLNAQERSSGTGGFLFFAETTVPVVRDLNNLQVRDEMNLSGAYKVVQFSRVDGDDASCLNLNRITNPRILGVDPGDVSGRFSLVSALSFVDKENPWLTLDEKLPGDAIPAFADETVIKWGMGKKTGDTLFYTDHYGKTVRLLLAGGLANSVFQGNVIISKKWFESHFPDNSGSNVFLVEAGAENGPAVEEELRQTFRDYGMEVEPAAKKLAEFYSVENTYLSIFLVMGALAILIGTVGLGFILARSILERKKEIAILKAVGISRKKVLKMIMNEYFILLVSGILAGVFSSVIATLPSILSPNTGISFSSIVYITILLLLNGILWISVLAWIYLRDPAISNALRNE